MYLSQELTIASLTFLFGLLLISFVKGTIVEKKRRKAKQNAKNNRAFEETFTRLRQDTEAKRTDIKRTFRAQPPITTCKHSTKETIYYPSLLTEDYITSQSQEETNDGSHTTDQ